jgi:uncharacterized membrane protein YfcA
LAVPTRSNRARNWRAAAAVLLGLVSVASLPVGVALAHYSDVDLIQAGYAVAPAFVAGVGAVLFARAARRRSERTIGRVGGERTARIGRLLGILGIYLALAGALSLAVYEVLDYLSA